MHIVINSSSLIQVVDAWSYIVYLIGTKGPVFKLIGTELPVFKLIGFVKPGLNSNAGTPTETHKAV